MELGGVENHIAVIHSARNVETMAQPTPVEPALELKGIREEKVEGTLNNAVAPLSHGDAKSDSVRVTVTVPTNAFAPTNGTLWVEYDPEMLELKEVQGSTDAFAWKQVEDGKVAIAFAEGAELANDSVIANLDFTVRSYGQTQVEVIWGEYGQECLELAEPIDVKTNPFTDVPEGEFYYEPVLWAVNEGITTGATKTTFVPEGRCQRAHVVTFLWRAAGCPEPTSNVNPFTDVKDGDFYYKAVIWAVEKGITNGMTDTTFGPYGYCNRAQVVTFLWRAMGKSEPTTTVNPFTDVDPDEWYGKAVLWAVENKVTNGMGGDIFGVESICNRAQVVTFLYRTYNR